MKANELNGFMYAVLGAARSGVAAAALLKELGLDVAVFDEKPEDKAVELKAELGALGIESYWGAGAFGKIASRQIIVLSPGIPREHPVVAEALKRGVRVIAEVELAAAVSDPAARIVAVTGTNGKTTTTAWIAHLLQADGLNAVLVGNIGEAWSKHAARPENRGADTVFVAELSSFQLESIEDLRPTVAVLTNLAPDHLDRYGTFEKYVAAKRHLLRNMGEGDCLVFNGGNEPSKDFVSGLRVREVPFHLGEDDGQPSAFLRNGMLMVRGLDGVEMALIEERDLPLPGRHNMENALAAAMAAILVGASPEAVRQGLRSFSGVEHRIELCGTRESDGVRFFNDSKATNLDSLEKALASFDEPIVLIAGGRDKNSDYDTLRSLVKERVAHLVTVGEAAPLIEKSWGGDVTWERATSMKDAVRRAAATARAGHVVLLSPACTSYDMYANFEERGRDFKVCVRKLLESGE